MSMLDPKVGPGTQYFPVASGFLELQLPSGNAEDGLLEGRRGAVHVCIMPSDTQSTAQIILQSTGSMNDPGSFRLEGSTCAYACES